MGMRTLNVDKRYLDDYFINMQSQFPIYVTLATNNSQPTSTINMYSK